MPVGIVENGVVISPSRIRHATKERRQAPILILSPPIEGMVVTLAAFDPAAEEDPDLLVRDLLGQVGLVRAVQNHSRGAVVTLSGDVFARNLIVGLVLRDTLADPFPVHIQPAVIASHTEQIGETESPEISVFRRVQQQID